jgi:probable HAF family extracellular repeat protein
MTSRYLQRTALLALLAAACGLTAAHLAHGGKGKPPPAAYPYKFTDFGAPAYASSTSKAYGMTEPNADGVSLIVGGGVATPSPNFATAWTATPDGLLSAGVIPGSNGGTVAVNDAGMIAYFGYSESQGAYAGMVDVPDVGTVELWPDFRPTAVNNLGQVAGRFYDIGWLQTVEPDGSLTTWAWLDDFVPYAINDWGEMAGQQGGHAAIAWFEDGVLLVQTLPGLFAGDYGRATAINNFGEVVGVSASNVIGTIGISGYYRPFLWDYVTGLVALTGNVQGAALDINDSGQVVGWSTNSKYYAFLWENGTLSDLNVLSGAGTRNFRLGSAEVINNAGQIIGRSDTWKGTYAVSHSTFLLTPKP